MVRCELSYPHIRSSNPRLRLTAVELCRTRSLRLRSQRWSDCLLFAGTQHLLFSVEFQLINFFRPILARSRATDPQKLFRQPRWRRSSNALPYVLFHRITDFFACPRVYCHSAERVDLRSHPIQLLHCARALHPRNRNRIRFWAQKWTVCEWSKRYEGAIPAL